MNKKFFWSSLSVIFGVILIAVIHDFSFRTEVIFYWDGQNYQQKIEKSRHPLLIKKERLVSGQLDFDGDGKFEEIILKNGTIFVKKNQNIIWQSEKDWQVENLFLADLNRDGRTEINFSLWKQGSYGKTLPFWLKENTKEWGNHFFIYGWEKGELRPVWCSSTIDAPIIEMGAGDIDSNGKDEVIVLEGDYDRPQNNIVEYLTIWSWNGWGFFNDFRSRKGKFYNLSIKKLKDGNVIEVFDR